MKYNKGLSCSRVTILSPKECEVFYPGVITSNMMCAGLDQGQDPCQVQTGQGGSLTGGSRTGRLWENRHPRLPAQFPPHVQHYPASTPNVNPCSTLLPYAFLSTSFSRPTLSPAPLPSPSPHPVCVAQSYLTLCDPMGRSSPGSSVHAISQARILEPVAIFFSQPHPTPP